MKQILIVEDDSFLNKMLAYNLTADGYGVTSALNARTAAEAIRQREFDLVLLDINLPDGNGFELCKLIKPQHPDTIVIFLTANDQESDQIRGYEVGAVDYITKPFVIGALQRKIKAMFAMLEHHKPAKDIYDDGRLFLDFSEQTASLNGKPLTLSPMEYKMLNLFRKNPRQVLTRGQLLEKLWDFYGTGSAFCTPSGIGSGACRLRKPSAPRSPETAARRRKCPWPVCGVPAWRTWL